MRRWVAWALAVLTAGGTAWLLVVLSATLTFGVSPGYGLAFQILAVPLGAVATFALVWQLVSGRPLRTRFWLVAVPLAFVILAVGVVPLLFGLAAPLGSFVAMAALALGVSSVLPLSA